MSAATLAWLITLILWLVFIIITAIAVQRNNSEVSTVGVILQFVCVGFMWIFLGLSAGWW